MFFVRKMKLRKQGQDTSRHVFKMFSIYPELDKWSSNDLLFVRKTFLPVLVFHFCLFCRASFVFALYPFDTRI